MGFPGYFLIVSDFIKWAKAHGIPVGPGRGSGAGSLVAYSLTITDLDPLRFGLIFERFLNPERVSMPDFDIDFCQERRGEVITYVQEKYGRDRVAQIITFGTLQARAVLRDVGRVLQLPLGLVDRLAKMVPNNPANPTTLAKAIEIEPRLQQAKADDEAVAHLLEIALQLEGLYPQRLDPRRRGGHRRPAADRAGAAVQGPALGAAGHPVQHEVGRERRPGEVRLPRPEDPDRARPGGASTWRKRGAGLDLELLPLDDAATYELMAQGQTVGVFQFEGQGMRDTLRKLRPGSIEDVTALGRALPPGADGQHRHLRRLQVRPQADRRAAPLAGSRC